VEVSSGWLGNGRRLQFGKGHHQAQWQRPYWRWWHQSVAAHTWYCNREMEEGVRFVQASNKDSNGGVAHRHMKKVERGGAPAVRTRAQPRRREEAWRCSGFGIGGAAGLVSAMPGRRRPTMVWRRASAATEMKWPGGEGAMAPTRSSCGSDELGELHGSWARRSADAEKSMTLLEIRARAVARRGSYEEAEDGGVEGGGVEGGGAEIRQPDDTKPNFTVIRVLHRRGYSPYTRYIFGIG
jgi:hypothetical protein